MSEITLVNSAQSTAIDTIEVFYTSPSQGGGTKITAYTAANNTSSNKSYKGYIFDSTGTILDAVVPNRIIVRDRFDPGASIVGQLIPAGGTLRFESSSIAGISWRVVGNEL